MAKSGDGNSERDKAPGVDRSSDKAGKRTPSDDSNESNELLGEITTKKYREIEDRLKDLKLQQLLISRSLRILDAEGRILGSKKQSAQCYRFVGYEQPLRTPCSE